MLIRCIFLFLIALPLSVGGTALADHAGGSANLKGQFLVAAPSLGDPRFAKTVILIIKHGDAGAMGLIVKIEQPEVWKLEFDVISHPGIPI